MCWCDSMSNCDEVGVITPEAWDRLVHRRLIAAAMDDMREATRVIEEAYTAGAMQGEARVMFEMQPIGALRRFKVVLV